MKEKKDIWTMMAVLLFIIIALFLIYNLGYGLGQFIGKVTK